MSTTPTRSESGGASGSPGFPLFLGIHSLLIGLLPFYLPVWLWRAGLDLAGLSLLIGTSGLAFAAALTPWERLARTRSRRDLVALTLVLELVLVALVFAIGRDGVAQAPLLAALVIGIAAGAYNAFFWTTQRVMFAATLGLDDVGRRYGNLQIVVTVLLKLGIVVGGLLLERHGLGVVVLLSAAIAVGGLWRLHRELPDTPVIRPGHDRPEGAGRPHGAGATFGVDGVFLLLESHFWTLSLFLVIGENFAALGATVVLLGLAFTLLFWVARSFVDRIRPAPFYRLTVLAYALSWPLRATVDDLSGEPSTERWLIPLLIVITFLSSLFRLTFNKRFFEHARREGIAPYLLFKSRVSQTSLGLAFLGVALALVLGPAPALHALDTSYLAAGALALAYLAYRTPAPARC